MKIWEDSSTREEERPVIWGPSSGRLIPPVFVEMSEFVSVFGFVYDRGGMGRPPGRDLQWRVRLYPTGVLAQKSPASF